MPLPRGASMKSTVGLFDTRGCLFLALEFPLLFPLWVLSVVFFSLLFFLFCLVLSYVILFLLCLSV